MILNAQYVDFAARCDYISSWNTSVENKHSHLKPSGYFMYRQVQNFKKIYVLPTQ
jgi:hypothetical protein